MSGRIRFRERGRGGKMQVSFQVIGIGDGGKQKIRVHGSKTPKRGRGKEKTTGGKGWGTKAKKGLEDVLHGSESRKREKTDGELSGRQNLNPLSRWRLGGDLAKGKRKRAAL